jgi:hypothetical protein
MTDLLVEIIEKIENGDGHIKVSNVVKYSEWLGITGRDLFNEKYLPDVNNQK